MRTIEYPVHGTHSYIARIIEEEGNPTYTVELHKQKSKSETSSLPWWLQFFLYEDEEEQPLITQKFSYSTHFKDAINRLVWQYERPLRYFQKLHECDGL